MKHKFKTGDKVILKTGDEPSAVELSAIIQTPLNNETMDGDKIYPWYRVQLLDDKGKPRPRALVTVAENKLVAAPKPREVKK